MGEGHANARFYPLGMLRDEANIVTLRLNGMEATRAVLLQLAVSSMFSKDAAKAFNERITALQEG